jgi:hypothetical protein
MERGKTNVLVCTEPVCPAPDMVNVPDPDLSMQGPTMEYWTVREIVLLKGCPERDHC